VCPRTQFVASLTVLAVLAVFVAPSVDLPDFVKITQMALPVMLAALLLANFGSSERSLRACPVTAALSEVLFKNRALRI
jgi:hypothetical protein